MRTLIASLLAVSLLAGLAGAAAAETPKKKKKKPAQTAEQSQQARERGETINQFDPDKQKFGSNEWWRAMDAEGRGGQNRP